jgi:succinyl-CoA synthetase beta subunit
MNIHEYQAKAIFRDFGVPVPEGDVAETAVKAREIASSLKGDKIVLKAQIHAGGRGKAGGIRLVSTPDEAEKTAKEMLGRPLVTRQTGPEGKVVSKILIERGMDIRTEIYAGVTVDRGTRRVVVMGSEAGGVEIEEVARETPEKILSEWVDPAIGFRPFQAFRLAKGLRFPSSLVRQGGGILSALYRLFLTLDCTLVEINPLVITSGDGLVALDGKVNFDDNALFRHRQIGELRDPHEEETLEKEASKHNLRYIKLDGNVGCVVNGAGLAMATMDLIKLAGGDPANFLDVGGGATVETVKNGFQIILSDPKVQAIFVNIFGGIARCDVLAEGVVQATREVGATVPLVIRLEGTNVDEGRRILKESGLHFMTATDLNDAADKLMSVLKKQPC